MGKTPQQVAEATLSTQKEYEASLRYQKRTIETQLGKAVNHRWALEAIVDSFKQEVVPSE